MLIFFWVADMKKLIFVLSFAFCFILPVMAEEQTELNKSVEFYNSAVTDYKSEKYVPALKSLNKAIAEEPENDLYLFTRGVLRYDAFKDYPGAIADLKKVEEINPDYPELYSELAYVSVFNHDIPGANEYLAIAETKGKNDLKIFLTRALICIAYQNYSGAILQYDKAIEIYPENSDLYLRRGYAKSYMRKYREAMKDYDKAIELNPKNYSAYEKRAEIHNTMLRSGKARKDWIKSDELRFERNGKKD